MNRPGKIGLVASGYVVALLIASAFVAIYIAATSGPDRLSSGGMYAFGDSLLFLAVFGVASVPATGAALFFLGPYRSFWRALSVIALAMAATSLAALFGYVAGRSAGADSFLHTWSPLAVLRILVAPLFALGFFLSALFAPVRSFRIALLLASAIETVSFGFVVLLWLQSP